MQLRTLIAALAAAVMAPCALAQSYSTKSVKMIVGFPPGGSYTLMMSHANSHAIAPDLMAKLPYDPLNELATVMRAEVANYGKQVNDANIRLE